MNINLPQNLNMNFEQNMGTMDRIIRSAIGGALLINGLTHPEQGPWNLVSSIIGGAFVIYGLTGFDPLLSALDVNTQPGHERNIANRMRTVTPRMREGQGGKMQQQARQAQGKMEETLRTR
jgi:uncharacterized membrane protein